MINFLGWLETNKKKLAISASVVLVLGLVIGSVIYQQSQKEIRASQALSEVRPPSNPGQPPSPARAEDYLKVANDHKGTKAGGRALLMAASTLFIEGKYAEAQQQFQRFVADYPDSVFASQGHFGIAASLDAQKKVSEATTKYEEIRKRYGNDSIIDEVKLALGRLYEVQNKPGEAYKLYDELLKAPGANFTGVGNEAGIRMEELTQKHPELAKTNAPPAAVPPTLATLTNRPSPGTNVLRMTNQPTTGASNVIRQVLTNAAAGTNKPAAPPTAAPKTP